jgi:sterol desaturase/sphingolipid hydroxylase (fatty acid hydroxylase superfamily)
MAEDHGFVSPLQDDNVKIKNNGHPKLFKNPILEVLSLSSPLITLVAYGSYISVMIFLNSTELGGVEGISNIVGLYFIGFLCWTLAEYLLHRHVFHFVSDNKYFMRFHYVMHGYHHEYPRDAHRLFMPPLPGAMISGLFLGIFYLLIGDIAFVFTGGFVSGYLFYTMMHFSMHRFKPPKFLKGLWRHHALHHYKYSNRAFGVSSPLWDHIFRTMPPNKEGKEKAQAS